VMSLPDRRQRATFTNSTTMARGKRPWSRA
jgi:hypothetical protein